MTLREAEFAALRQTIAARGTTRIVLCPLVVFAWSLSVGATSELDNLIASLVSLAVLAAGFEAIHALHVGVERIGRYLQAFYEAGMDGPKWETTSMAIGPTLPGGGVDPLFTAMFGGAAALNLGIALLNRPAYGGLAILALVHLGAAFRLARARVAAARQRAVDLESFRALKLRDDGKT